MSRAIVVKVTCGAEAPERCNQGLTVAATAAASGIRVGLWLAGEATWFAARGSTLDLGLDGATPAAELIGAVLASDATVTACSQCLTRRGLETDDLVAGVIVAGAAAFVEAVTARDVQALVY